MSDAGRRKKILIRFFSSLIRGLMQEFRRIFKASHIRDFDASFSQHFAVTCVNVVANETGDGFTTQLIYSDTLIANPLSDDGSLSSALVLRLFVIY